MKNSGKDELYLLAFYAPVEAAEEVKEALFLAGAGCYQHYDRCAWETLGTGQFRPLADSKPFQGTHGTLERVPELKIELICKKDCIKKVLEALLLAHPYEEPAYHFLPLPNFQG